MKLNYIGEDGTAASIFLLRLLLRYSVFILDQVRAFVSPNVVLNGIAATCVSLVCISLWFDPTLYPHSTCQHLPEMASTPLGRDLRLRRDRRRHGRHHSGLSPGPARVPCCFGGGGWLL